MTNSGISPAGKEPLPIHLQPGGLSWEQISEMMESFSAGPITEPEIPKPHDPESAQSKIISSDSIDLSTTPPTQNASKLEAIKSKLGDLRQYAEDHPILTGLLVTAILGICLSIAATVLAYQGITSFHLFGQTIPIPLKGALFITGVGTIIGLISFSRQYAMESLETIRTASNAKLIEKINLGTMDPANAMRRYNDAIEALGSMIEEKKQQREKALEISKNLQATIKKMWDLQGEGLKNTLSTQLNEDFFQEFLKAQKLYLEASKLLEKQDFIPSEPPALLEIEVPSFPTPTMIDNQVSQASLIKQMSSYFGYVFASPGSKAWGIAALVSLCVSGVFIYLYLHGVTDYYYLGPLSHIDLTVIIAMMGFTSPLLFAAKVNADINYTKVSMDKLAQKDKELREILQKRDEVLKQIEKEGGKKVLEYTKQLKDLTSISLTQEEMEELLTTDAICQTKIRDFTAYCAQVTDLQGQIAELTKKLQEAQQGAKLTSVVDKPSL